MKHLFQYLEKPAVTSLYTKKLMIQNYSDFNASYNSYKESGHSTNGYITIICGGGSSKLFVILSSTEAEYVAAVEASKEIKQIRNILTEFGYFSFHASIFFIDNKFGIEVSKNLEHHKCMKHLDL